MDKRVAQKRALAKHIIILSCRILDPTKLQKSATIILPISSFKAFVWGRYRIQWYARFLVELLPTDRNQAGSVCSVDDHLV